LQFSFVNFLFGRTFAISVVFADCSSYGHYSSIYHSNVSL